MWFLIFYSISLVICIIVTIIIGKSISNKLKREHPEIKIKKHSFSEVISAFLPYTIPFLNLIFILFLILQQEKVYLGVVDKFSNKEIER